eukprot:gene11179-12465_t
MWDNRIILAKILAKKGKWSLAIKIFEHALQSAAANAALSLEDEISIAHCYFNLAQCLVGQGEDERETISGWMERAIEALQKALQHLADFPEAHLNLSALFIKTGLAAQAYEHACEGLDRARDKGDSLIIRQLSNNVDVSLRLLGRPQEAIETAWRRMQLPAGISSSSLLSMIRDRQSAVTEDSLAPDNAVLTIVCVKVGKKYSSAYVNNLYHMVQRHWHPSPSNFIQRFRMVCITEDSEGLEKEIIVAGDPPQCAGAMGWWAKVEVFNTAVYSQPNSHILYLDLDTIICRYSVSELVFEIHRQTTLSHSRTVVTLPSIFFLDAAGFRNEGRGRGINSSLMLFPARLFDFLYDIFLQHASSWRQYCFKFDYFLEMVFAETFYDSIASDDIDNNGDANDGDHPKLAYCVQDCHALESVILDASSLVDKPSLCHLDSDSRGNIQEEEEGVVNDLAGILCFPLRPKPHELPPEHVLYRLWEGSIW